MSEQQTPAPPAAEALRSPPAADPEAARLDREALAVARGCAQALGLAVKLFRVERIEGDRTIFYLSGDRRLELKELAQAMAERFPGRLELRQLGVRDEAKLVGGIGSCGRELCCTTFLPRFAPVTIRMAKNQNLALNPTRVSGQCGRLKCCLVYEEAQYQQARQALPAVGASVQTPDGPGRVQDVEPLAGRVRVSFPDRPPLVYQHGQLLR
jgi:cell fate regulator YaaT (PSP1 superfamily)